jgi:hypothetical protein
MTPKEAPFGTPMEELRFLQKLEPIGNAFWLRFEYIAQSLTEHEELKLDVKRYFETRNKLKTILPSAKDITEFWELEEKLLKVGKE